MTGPPSIKQVPTDKLAGRWILLRLDLNLPIDEEGEVSDDFRLRKVLPTIEYLRRRGGRLLILSHLSRPEASLKPIANRLKDFFAVYFANDLESAKRVQTEVSAETAILLENLRRFPGEMENDQEFAAALAKLGEIYVNEAFASSHRTHASIVGLPNHLPSYAGLLFSEEILNLSRIFTPLHPFTVILGGLKFSTKLPLIQRLIGLTDQIFVYGALAHAFFRELGYELGRSLVENDSRLERSLLKHPKIVLPADVRVQNGERVFIKPPDQLVATDNILDVGLTAIERLLPAINRSRFILWNGPLGFFEAGWRSSTEAAARFIAASNAVSIVGGGDTVTAIHSLNLLNQFDFVSTGGGAMLQFLASGSLPGIEALIKNGEPEQGRTA